MNRIEKNLSRGKFKLEHLKKKISNAIFIKRSLAAEASSKLLLNINQIIASQSRKREKYINSQRWTLTGFPPPLLPTLTIVTSTFPVRMIKFSTVLSRYGIIQIRFRVGDTWAASIACVIHYENSKIAVCIGRCIYAQWRGTRSIYRMENFLLLFRRKEINFWFRRWSDENDGRIEWKILF